MIPLSDPNQPLINGINEAFVRLNPVVMREHIPLEKPEPLELPPADTERVTHPGFNQADQSQGGIRSYLEEQRLTNAELLEMFRLLALEHRQMRIELNDIRGYVERSRLL